MDDGGCRYGGVAREERSYCLVVGEFVCVCVPNSVGYIAFSCCFAVLYLLENGFCENLK